MTVFFFFFFHFDGTEQEGKGALVSDGRKAQGMFVRHGVRNTLQERAWSQSIAMAKRVEAEGNEE